jgi:hypothetical protein
MRRATIYPTCWLKKNIVGVDNGGGRGVTSIANAIKKIYIIIKCGGGSGIGGEDGRGGGDGKKNGGGGRNECCVLYCRCLTIVINIHKQNNIMLHKQIHANQNKVTYKNTRIQAQNIYNKIQTLCVMKSCINTQKTYKT